MHWPELHSLFNSSSSSQTRRQNVINNPDVVAYFFTQRLERFIKHWLYETLDADWHWYHYEYQKIRGSIHCHETAKLKNDPGLCNLTEIALKGFLAEQKCTAESVHDDTLQQQINEGKQAEQTICQYVDWLLSTENPCPPEDFDWVKPAVHPCQVSYDDIGLSEYDEDYTNLLNTVQRHTKCNSAYCLKRKRPNKDITWGFNFPFEKCSQTYDDIIISLNKSQVKMKLRSIVQRLLQREMIWD